MYYLQPDGTHTLFEVKYDDDGNFIELKQISRGHNIVWNLNIIT